MRYFLAFYKGKHFTADFVGNISFESLEFPSRKNLCVELEDLHGMTDVCITNIHEFETEWDYINWNR